MSEAQSSEKKLSTYRVSESSAVAMSTAAGKAAADLANILDTIDSHLEDHGDVPEDLVPAMGFAIERVVEETDRLGGLRTMLADYVKASKARLDVERTRHAALERMDKFLKGYSLDLVNRFPKIDFTGKRYRLAKQNVGGQRGIDWHVRFEADVTNIISMEEAMGLPDRLVRKVTVFVLDKDEVKRELEHWEEVQKSNGSQTWDAEEAEPVPSWLSRLATLRPRGETVLVRSAQK